MTEAKAQFERARGIEYVMPVARQEDGRLHSKLDKLYEEMVSISVSGSGGVLGDIESSPAGSLFTIELGDDSDGVDVSEIAKVVKSSGLTSRDVKDIQLRAYCYERVTVPMNLKH